MTEIELKRRKPLFRRYIDIISFLKNPDGHRLDGLPVGRKLKDVFSIFLLKYAASILLLMLIGFVVDKHNNAGKGIIESYPPITALLAGGIIAPLVEESLYRLSIFFKPVFLGISTGVAAFILVSRLYYDVGILTFDHSTALRLLIAVGLGVAAFLVSKMYMAQLERFWRINFKHIFYASAILFGLSHYVNYKLTMDELYMAPFVTLPHLVGGLLFGYIRVKYGFIYCLLIHIVNNLIALSIGILF